MSYNVGVYTSPTGAETAFAGQTIASATWNAINTDYATAFGQIGTATLTSIPVIVSFSITATDTIIPIPALPGFKSYVLGNLTIAAPSIVPPTGSVSLFTATGGGGTTLIGSTGITITSTVSGLNNNAQSIASSLVNTIALTGSVIYIRCSLSASFTASVTMQVRWIA